LYAGTKPVLHTRRQVHILGVQLADLAANLVVQGHYCGSLDNESSNRGQADFRGRTGDERSLLLR
jgi:hypothetical protein